MSFDYQSLRTQAIAVAEDDSVEFADYLDTGLMLAETRLFRDLDTFGLVSYTTLSCSSGNMLMTIPSGTRITKSLTYLDAAGTATNLLLRTDEFIKDFWPIRTSVGLPKYYAKWGYNQIALAPTPVSDAGIEFAIIVAPSALTSATPSNWFTEYAGDAIFYALNCEMMVFAKNPTAFAIWDARYKMAIETLQNEARRTRRDDMQEPASPGQEDLIDVNQDRFVTRAIERLTGKA